MFDFYILPSEVFKKFLVNFHTTTVSFTILAMAPNSVYALISENYSPEASSSIVAWQFFVIHAGITTLYHKAQVSAQKQLPSKQCLSRIILKIQCASDISPLVPNICNLMYEQLLTKQAWPTFLLQKCN